MSNMGAKWSAAATRSLAVLGSALVVVLLCVPGVLGQPNPLIGSWRSSGETGSNGYEITYTYLVTFNPNGSYENRMDVAGKSDNARNRGAGTTIIRGEYRMTSSNAYVFRERSAVQCPVGVGCYPARQLPPDFGAPKQVHFDMVSPTELRVNGATYYRVR